MVEHIPVLAGEVLEFLNVKKDGLYVDATVGGGGHGEEILKSGGKLLGLDWDRDALAIARQKLEGGGWKLEEDFILGHLNFARIAEVAKENNFVPADGVLFDLGVSSMQLGSERGFSFQQDAPLDMRMDPANQGVTAADLLNSLREDQLYELFKETCEKNTARAVAHAIVFRRQDKGFERTSQLVDLVNQVYQGRRRKISPATTIFLALRMAVNSELENLKEGLLGALEILGRGGRLVVISFHSGEDRIVKNFLKDMTVKGELKILTKKPVVATAAEVAVNPRSRSAKLRAGEAKLTKELI